jgi:hypothetical protein
MACALDQSAGCLVFELLGTGVADVLSSLLDASAVPRQSGRVTRARLMDIAALVMRRDVDCVWLLVDRGHGHYTSQWIAHALRAAPLPM